ncbi:MAG: helix-turn-helix domain-containing protein [Acidimicrobiales bacterium]
MQEAEPVCLGALQGVAEPETPSWAAELSPRDVNVLRLLSEGRSTAGIADDLAYSESTIKNIIHDLVSQLGARNRAHAVAMAIRAGLI